MAYQIFHAYVKWNGRPVITAVTRLPFCSPQFSVHKPIEKSGRRTLDDSLDHHQQASRLQPDDDVAEVVFFAYDVFVFFGLEGQQETDIVEDIESSNEKSRKAAGRLRNVTLRYGVPISLIFSPLTHWYSMTRISRIPRIYNDFFSV